MRVSQSDMAAASSGHKGTDHLRIVALVEAAAEFAFDVLEPGGTFVAKVLAGGAEQGLQALRSRRSDVSLTLFNMDDPIVGGYTPDKVALRRAISLAVDVDAEIRLVLGGQAMAAQSPVPPNTHAYDPTFKSENADHDPARAKALLDLYGYVD